MKVRFSSSLVIRRSSLVTRHLPLLLLLVAVGLTASPALAQTTANWNDGNGNWTTASDWNCPTTGVNCVPNNSGGNTYNVVINSSGGNVTLDHTSSLSSVTINALTLGAGNQLNVSDAESLTVNGNLDNSGSYTQGYAATAATVVTVSGKLTNEATGNMRLYADFSNYQGTMNVGTLANSGNLEIDSQQTMNLTNQPGGVTDIVAGSTLNQYGTFNVTNGLNGPVTSAALANLGSIEGNLTLGSADQALTITPGGTSGGTLTNTGQLNVTNAQQLTVSGNLDNSGSYTQGYAATAPTVVTVIGTLTNEASGTVHLYNNFGGYQGTMTVAGLNNAGTVYIDGGQTLAINPTLPNPPSEGLVSTETNSGTINLAPSYSTSGSTLAFNDGGAANTIKLSGKGSINLYNVNDAITSDGYTLTLENVDNTIQGTGNIGKGVSELINDAGGTILANATGLNNDPAINTPLTIAPRDQFINNGTVHVVTSGFGNPPAPAGNTLVLDLSTTGFEAGFTNNGTVTVDDGSTLQVYFSNKFVGSPEIDNNGAINLGSSTGATMQLNGSGEQFTLESTNSTPGTITLAGGSTLTGVTGTESLINSVGTTFGGPKGSANTIQGNGSITNLFLDNNGAIVANNGVLDIAPNNSGVTNDFTGTMQATSGNTLELDLTKTSYATGSTPPPPGSHGGFENFGTVTAADGGTLEFTDTTSSSTVLIQDSGPTNVGSSTGGTVLLSDQGHGATFDFNSLNGGGQPLTLVNSAIKGVSGDETLINDEVIDGTGTITHLAALTNNGALAASGGTLDLSTINLTNLSGGVLTNGSYELLNNGAQQNATLKLPGDVNTLNGAYLQLTATNYKVLDPMGGNAIANLNTLENGGYLEVDSGVTFNSANNFTDGSPTDSGNNTLRADGGTVNIGSPTTSASLNVNSSFLGAVFGGVVNVYGNLTNTDGAVETGTGFGTDPGGNVLNVTGNYVNTTSGSGPSGATLLLDTKNDSVTVGGNFSNNGTVSVGSCDLSTGACSSGMSLTVHGSAGFTQTAGDTIVGGTLTAPTVNINGGQLMGTGTIVGNVTNGGTAAGGIIPTLFYGSTTAPGTLSITGNYTQTSGGTLDELISGTAAGQFSVINATGSMTLGGALDVSTLNGFTFANGQSFDILNFTGRSGEFGTFTYGSYSGSGSSPLDIGGGLELELAYNNNDVLLNVGQMNTSNTDNWIDTTDNWNNSANYAADWSTGAIPTSTQDVVVGTGAGGTVTYNDANDTVSSLTVQKGTSSNYTLAFDASDKLTVTNAVNINAGGEIAVAVSGASLSASSLANNAGTLKVANGGSVSTTGGLSNANAGTVTVAGALSSISVGGTLTNDSTSTVQVQNGGALSAGSVTNSGSVFTGNATGDTGNNTLTVTGAFTNNSGGSVSLMANKDSATAGSFSNAGTVSLAAGTTLAVNGSSGYTQSGGTTKVNGTLTANQYTQSGGTTTVAAGGTLTASTQYSQSSGTTDVDGTLITPTFSLTGGLLTGTGKVQGNVSNTGGMLDPGDEPGAGTFSVTGNYAQGSGGTIMADINGGAPGSFDVLDVGALASLNGTLDISLNNGFMPVNNEQFVILDAMGGLNGTFSTIMGQDFGPGNADSWNISYLNNKVTLTANIGKTSPTPEPASLMLFGTGLLGLAWVTRRRMRAGA